MKCRKLGFRWLDNFFRPQSSEKVDPRNKPRITKPQQKTLSLYDTWYFALLPNESDYSVKLYAQTKGLRKVIHTEHQKEGNKNTTDQFAAVN